MTQGLNNNNYNCTEKYFHIILSNLEFNFTTNFKIKNKLFHLKKLEVNKYFDMFSIIQTICVTIADIKIKNVFYLKLKF